MRLPPSYLINTLAFVRLVLKEVEISVMLVLDPVCAGYSHHCPREFAVLAVLVGEARCVKRNAYLLIILAVIAPVELRVPAVYHKPEINRYIIDRSACVHKFRLFSVFKLYHRNSALTQSFAVILTEIDVVHVVIVEDKPRTVLVNLRLEIHLCRHLPCPAFCKTVSGL